MKRLAWLVAAGIMATLAHAQDADLFFSGRTQTVLDPSRAGFDPGGRISFLHQDQWLQMPGAWRNEQLTVEWCLRNNRKQVNSWLGLGLSASRDKQMDVGARSTVGIMPAIHLRTGSRSFLSSGLEVRWASGTAGNAGGAWGNQYNGMHFDPSLASGEQWTTGTRSWAEARAGLSFTLKNAQESRLRRERNVLVAGVAADHLGRLVLHGDDALFPEIPVRFTAYALGELPHEIWGNGFFAAEAIAQVQGPFRTARLNVYAGKHLLNLIRSAGGAPLLGFKAGLGYQFGNALLVNAAMDWGRATFGMAYGWSVFGADRMAGGRRTFELLVQVRLAGGVR